MFDELARHGVLLTDEIKESCVRIIKQSHPGERVYITPADSRKDPARKQKIIEAARMLPTAVVAERYGVTQSWVNRAAKK